jgi:hypothetical protein
MLKQAKASRENLLCNKPSAVRGIFVLSVLLFLCVQSYAQKIRFTDTTNRWYICNTDPWVPKSLRHSFVKEFKGGMIIGGLQYHFYTFHNWGYQLIREDTLTGKIYCRRPQDTFDVLMYDYNLAVGDTIVSYAMGDTTLLTVSSTSMVQINNVSHKVWAFNPGGTLVEGIGTGLGPGMFEPPGPDKWSPTCCFENNGARVIFSPKPWTTMDCTLSIDEIDYNEVTAGVLTNPLTPDSRIVLPQLAEIAKLKIINTAGQRVVDKTLKHVREIPLGEYELPAGVYFYTVKDAKLQNAYKGKFTVR